jgi:hypothetical protein
VIQDDTIACRNFAPALERVAEANPDTPVLLFISRIPRRTYNLASLRYGKSRYVDHHLQDLVHVVAILWPVEVARSFIEWVDANERRLPHRGMLTTSDDAIVTRWMRLTSTRLRVTVPCLVEHPDDVPSTVNQHKVRHGRDSGRTAAYWIGDGDPLDLDWSR